MNFHQCLSYLSFLILKGSRILDCGCPWWTDTSSQRSEGDPRLRPRWQWEWFACYSRPSTPPLTQEKERRSVGGYRKDSHLYWYIYQRITAWWRNRFSLFVHHCAGSVWSPPTFSIPSFVQGESLDLQGNQLDLQQRRHQKLILWFAFEALSISCLEHLAMGHQTWISLIWRERDTEQLLVSDSNINITIVRTGSHLCSYWRTFCRQAWETNEQSSWWQRKPSFPGDQNI